MPIFSSYLSGSGANSSRGGGSITGSFAVVGDSYVTGSLFVEGSGHPQLGKLVVRAICNA